MADPKSYRPATGDIPLRPGVYRFRDEVGRVIYVGKAKVLRSRLNSYFANPAGLTPKTHAMVHTAVSVEWTVVGSELEALQLEYTWIKEFNPRFNIVFRDDKSYPYLAVTMGEKYPRAQVMRGDKRKDTKYFGPFYPAKAIRETLDTLLRVFPVRSCCAGVFKRAESSGRPCLLGYIDKCAAPCVGRISPEDHKQLAADLCQFMGGEGTRFIRQLEKEDGRCRLRARLRAGSPATATTSPRCAGSSNATPWCWPKTPRRTSSPCTRTSSRPPYRSSTCATGASAASAAGSWKRSRTPRRQNSLSTCSPRSTARQPGTTGSRARCWSRCCPRTPSRSPPGCTSAAARQSRCAWPQRGDKAALAETVRENAEQALRLHKSRRAGDLTTRSRRPAGAPGRPGPAGAAAAHRVLRRLAHVQGTNVVASMVVFEDGLPKKSDYRKFSITGDAARDDTASMYDVISRRFKNYLAEIGRHRSGGHAGEIDIADASRRDMPAPPKFAYPPSLVIVDGGRRRWPRPPGRWPTWGSTTSTWSAWPSGLKKCGCPTTSSR